MVCKVVKSDVETPWDSSIDFRPLYSPPPSVYIVTIDFLKYISTIALYLEKIENTSDLWILGNNQVHFVKWSTDIT